MSERTKLLKKAVLTGVGATSNGERIKKALTEALDDLVKIGQELFEELEENGQLKAKHVQDYVSRLKGEAEKRSSKVSAKVQTSIEKTARDLGLATQAEVEELRQRLKQLERSPSAQPRPDMKKGSTKPNPGRRGSK